MGLGFLRYLDFASIMSYDLHGAWETHTGHHTALYPRSDETGDDRYLNVVSIICKFITKHQLLASFVSLFLPATGIINFEIRGCN